MQKEIKIGTLLRRISIFGIAVVIYTIACTGSKYFVSPTLINSINESYKGTIDARYYKKIGKKQLQLHIFYPNKYNKNRKKLYPVALSIHGGGWTQGPIKWGYSEAEYFASLGFVGVAVEYRLATNGSNSALDAMKDANSSVRWTRINAKDLNIDPNKVLVIGHSAGGHLSISTAMFPQFKEKSEEGKISSIPNIVWAYAPAVDLTRDNYFQGLLKGKERASNCSPAHNVKSGLVLMNIIHGTADEILPVSATRKFVKDMKASGNNINYWEYQNGTHNFFYQDVIGIEFCHKLVKEKVIESGWLN